MKKSLLLIPLTCSALLTACVERETVITEYRTTTPQTRYYYNQGHGYRASTPTPTYTTISRPATQVTVNYNKKDHHRRNRHTYQSQSGYQVQPSSYSQPNRGGYNNPYGPVHAGYSSQPSAPAPTPARPANPYGPVHAGYSSEPSQQPVKASEPMPQQSTGGFQAPQPSAPAPIAAPALVAPKPEAAPAPAPTPAPEAPKSETPAPQSEPTPAVSGSEPTPAS